MPAQTLDFLLLRNSQSASRSGSLKRGIENRLVEKERGKRKLEGNLRDRPRERPVLQGVCVSRRRRRSRQHCQQLGDFLRVASGVGSDATAEAVDGRAEPVQIDVVDSRIVDVERLCRNRSWIRHEGWLSRG